MRSRIVTVITVLGLAGATGGALAIAAAVDSNASGGAAVGQYCPPKSHGKGCKKHHPPPCPPNGKGCKRHRPPHPTLLPGHSVVSSTPAPPVVSTRFVSPFGFILVNGQGQTLYAFTSDRQKGVTCADICATVFPPDMLPSGTTPLAAGHVSPSLLGNDPDPTGGNVVTYNGWPLYAYAGDRTPGVADAQGLSRFGGVWYVVSPSGKPIKSK
jgi:predicted lipoprotein with Yx(FWY)xxD motif